MELNKVEQRYDAVLAVIRDGLTISEAAIAYGVSRQSIYRWMQRYEEGGLPARAERSHRPKACPHQIDPRVEGRIVALRQGHPSWRPIRIQHQLGREKVKELTCFAGIAHARLSRAAKTG
jgi:transposase